MKQCEFLRWLIDREVMIKDGTKHIKLYYNGRQSTLPRHPSKELSNGLVYSIKKQLNIK